MDTPTKDLLKDALQDIKNIPACTPSKAIKMLTNLIKVLSEEQKQRLYYFSLFYQPRVRALLGMIFEMINETQLQTLVRKTLNPLTKFQMEFESTLHTKQWNFI